jgi:hypothetical protein
MTLISYPNSQKAQVAMPATARLRRVPSRPMVDVYGVSFNILSDAFDATDGSVP